MSGRRNKSRQRRSRRSGSVEVHEQQLHPTRQIRDQVDSGSDRDSGSSSSSSDSDSDGEKRPRRKRPSSRSVSSNRDAKTTATVTAGEEEAHDKDERKSRDRDRDHDRDRSASTTHQGQTRRRRRRSLSPYGSSREENRLLALADDEETDIHTFTLPGHGDRIDFEPHHMDRYKRGDDDYGTFCFLCYAKDTGLEYKGDVSDSDIRKYPRTDIMFALRMINALCTDHVNRETELDDVNHLVDSIYKLYRERVQPSLIFFDSKKRHRQAPHWSRESIRYHFIQILATPQDRRMQLIRMWTNINEHMRVHLFFADPTNPARQRLHTENLKLTVTATRTLDSLLRSFQMCSNSTSQRKL